MPWDLTWKDFFIAFWPNFWSSLITGLLVGVIFSIYIAKRIGKELAFFEMKLKKEDEEIEKKKYKEKLINEIISDLDKIQSLLGDLNFENSDSTNKLYGLSLDLESYWKRELEILKEKLNLERGLLSLIEKFITEIQSFGFIPFRGYHNLEERDKYVSDRKGEIVSIKNAFLEEKKNISKYLTRNNQRVN